MTARSASRSRRASPCSALEPLSLAAGADRARLPEILTTAAAIRRRGSCASAYGFKGELRAVGDVLADQIPLMRRCGIASFEVRHAPTRAALAAGRLAEMHHFYQPIPTAREAPAGTRPWLRQPAN